MKRVRMMILEPLIVLGEIMSTEILELIIIDMLHRFRHQTQEIIYQVQVIGKELVE
jgi:hypothetical protein